MPRWQNNCPDLSNHKLQSWVEDPSSTCAKLGHLQFAMELLKVEQLSQWDLLQQHSAGWLRTSGLFLADKPWMLAQAWAPVTAENSMVADDLQKTAPLGSWLFSNDWQRSKFSYAQLPEFNQIAQQYLQSIVVAVRKSMFQNKDGSSLLLLELFLQHSMWEV